MPGPAVWLAGARPRTLPAAVVPVAVGTATLEEWPIWWRVVAALVVSLALQVGTNYVNDYADGVRGTDERRVGPVRLVAGGLATVGQVKRAAAAAFAVAAVTGLALALCCDVLLFARETSSLPRSARCSSVASESRPGSRAGATTQGSRGPDNPSIRQGGPGSVGQSANAPRVSPDET